MAHHSDNLLSLGFLFTFTHTFFSSSHSSLLFYQAAQMTHVIDGWLKELSKDAKWEKALKEVSVMTTKEKTKAAETIEKKAAVSEKAKELAEKRSTKLDGKLGEIELKLAKAASLNTS